MSRLFALAAVVVCSLLLLHTPADAANFKANARNNNVVYWGQGYTPKDVALRSWCQDSTFNVIQLSFMYKIVDPYVDCAFCWSGTFSGTTIPNAASVASDILYCQSKGIDIGLSYGGADAQMTYSSRTQAENTAVVVWNMFFGGSSSTRPFGSAKLDGIDFDLETETIDPNQVYFAKKLRALMDADTSKKYWMSAAPQCPWRDLAMGPDGTGYNGAVITNSLLGNVPMDFIAIQFYNNYCDLSSTDATYGFTPTYKLWHNWAVAQAPNTNMKIVVGYLSRQSLTTTLLKTQLASIASLSTFAGFMQWQAAELVSGVTPAIKTYIDSLANSTTPVTPPIPVKSSTAKAAPKSSTAKAAPKSSTASAAKSSTGKAPTGKVSTNGRCGASYGNTICNAYGDAPCCSPWGWCGATAAHCTCKGCIDYRVRLGAGGECGNGVVEDGEECDGGDCCTEDCTVKEECASSSGINLTLILSAGAGGVAVVGIVSALAVLMLVRRRRQRAAASARSSVSGSTVSSGAPSARTSVVEGMASATNVVVGEVAVPCAAAAPVVQGAGVSVGPAVVQAHQGSVSL